MNAIFTLRKERNQNSTEPGETKMLPPTRKAAGGAALSGRNRLKSWHFGGGGGGGGQEEDERKLLSTLIFLSCLDRLRSCAVAVFLFGENIFHSFLPNSIYFPLCVVLWVGPGASRA